MKIVLYWLTLILTASIGILLIVMPTLAFDFKFAPNETILLNDDLNNQGNWQLPPVLSINSGFLGYNITGADFAVASYPLNHLGSGFGLDVNDGPINLYWRGIFPENPKREQNAYIPGLKYADDPHFCWNGESNEDVEIILISKESVCPEGLGTVTEDAEIRAWLSPTSPTVFTRLFVDPDFTPGVAPEQRDKSQFPFITLNGQPPSQKEYRLRIKKRNQNYEAQLFYLAGNSWVPLGQDTLVVKPSQWRFVVGQEEIGKPIYLYEIEHPVIFESINIQLRNDRESSDLDATTKIDAIALTQERIAVPKPGT